MRNPVVLLTCLLGACSPPAPGAEVPDGGVGAEARPEFVEVETEDGPRLQVRGLPALSADGRTVLSVRDSDYGSVFEYTETASGVMIASEDYPENTDDPYAEEPVTTTDYAARDRLLAEWESAGFRTLSRVPHLDRIELDEEVIEGFSDRRVRVEARVRRGLEAVIVVEDLASGRTLSPVVNDYVDSVEAVYVAPDGSFVVVQQMFCACECAWWSEVVPLVER